MIPKLKEFFKSHQEDLILLSGIILIALASFGLGRLSAPTHPKEPIKIEERGK